MQLITPNPDIPCQPGYCLQYVRQAFGLPARYPTATAAWEASASQHRGRDFPPGHWVPVWYGLDREPAGHVVLLAPDGSVYSTSDNSSIPHRHPDLADLEAFYAGWGWPLTYRGWTEDVAGYPVLTTDGLAAMAGTVTTINTEEDDMPELHEIVSAVLYEPIPKYLANGAPNGTTTLAECAAWQESNFYLGRKLTLDAIKETVMGVLSTAVKNVATGGTTNLATEVSWLPANFKRAGDAAADLDALAETIAEAVTKLTADKPAGAGQ